METADTINPPSTRDYDWTEIDSICLKAGVDACLFLKEQDVLIGIGPPIGETTEDGYPARNYTAEGYIMVTSTYEFCSPKLRMAFLKQVKTGVEFQSTMEDFHDEIKSLEGIESLISDYASEN